MCVEKVGIWKCEGLNSSNLGATKWTKCIPFFFFLAYEQVYCRVTSPIIICFTRKRKWKLQSVCCRTCWSMISNWLQTCRIVSASIYKAEPCSMSVWCRFLKCGTRPFLFHPRDNPVRTLVCCLDDSQVSVWTLRRFLPKHLGVLGGALVGRWDSWLS